MPGQSTYMIRFEECHTVSRGNIAVCALFVSDTDPLLAELLGESGFKKCASGRLWPEMRVGNQNQFFFLFLGFFRFLSGTFLARKLRDHHVRCAYGDFTVICYRTSRSAGVSIFKQGNNHYVGRGYAGVGINNAARPSGI
jgi:hypothetical protein